MARYLRLLALALMAGLTMAAVAQEKPKADEKAKPDVKKKAEEKPKAPATNKAVLKVTVPNETAELKI
ncbi:MAG: hypothetical protein JNK93_03395, partial [Planctomycetia bacterium]|nr:hypothetical protein [Planctomycetia bacterium]